MSLIVVKFGGTSLADIDCINHAANVVRNIVLDGHKVAVVVSAMGSETDKLVQFASQLVNPFSGNSEMDALLATGEQVAAALFSMALQKCDIKAISMNGYQAKIYTDEAYNKARITRIEPKGIMFHIDSGFVVVVTGFQGINKHNRITTLGRGGSDTSAVALAIALQADECRIYTDVDGIYTTDPRLEPNASWLPTITFEEMLEMASLGSKILQIRSVELAGRYNMPLRILSTFSGQLGTLITYEEPNMESEKISGIACNKDEAQLTVRDIPDRPGIAAALLQPIAERNIEVDMIVQNVGQRSGVADFSFTVLRQDYPLAMSVLKETALHLGARVVRGDEDIVKVSLVGIGMRSHAGVASKMFTALAKEDIDIRMITTSEIKISVILKKEFAKRAVQALHKAFDL